MVLCGSGRTFTLFPAPKLRPDSLQSAATLSPISHRVTKWQQNLGHLFSVQSSIQAREVMKI